MHRRIVKKSVPTPEAYVIPSAHAEKFEELLKRLAIENSTLDEAQFLTVERCILESFSDEYDEIYNRYSGLQRVTRKTPEEVKLPAGSLLVPLDTATGLRAALLLEPTLLYGLYQFERFRDLVGDDGLLPVLRVMVPDVPPR